MTSYHVGFRDQAPVMLAVAAEFLTTPYPAWTAVGVTELIDPEAVIESAVWRWPASSRTVHMNAFSECRAGDLKRAESTTRPRPGTWSGRTEDVLRCARRQRSGRETSSSTGVGSEDAGLTRRWPCLPGSTPPTARSVRPRAPQGGAPSASVLSGLHRLHDPRLRVQDDLALDAAPHLRASHRAAPRPRLACRTRGRSGRSWDRRAVAVPGNVARPTLSGRRGHCRKPSSSPSKSGTACSILRIGMSSLLCWASRGRPSGEHAAAHARTREGTRRGALAGAPRGALPEVVGRSGLVRRPRASSTRKQRPLQARWRAARSPHRPAHGLGERRVTHEPLQLSRATRNASGW